MLVAINPHVKKKIQAENLLVLSIKIHYKNSNLIAIPPKG